MEQFRKMRSDGPDGRSFVQLYINIYTYLYYIILCYIILYYIVAQVLCVGTWEDSMPNAEGVRLEKFQRNLIDWGSRPWWCDRTRYPDEPARIAREIMQGVIHLKPLQHDPSPGLGGTYGPFSLAQTTKDARRVDPLRSHQESDSFGVPPWWCDRARYPDEPARIAREIPAGRHPS